MSTRGMWIVFATVIVPGIVIVGLFQEAPIQFIVIVGLFMFFAMGAGINLGELREIAREHEARKTKRALDRARALDRERVDTLDFDDERST